MSNKTKISITFWAHFLVASASHVFVLLMIGGCIKLVLATAALDFWVKGLLLGITFYTAMYATNHVTNHQGFCVLTDIENFYRRKEGMPEVDAFTPRYYRKCGSIISSIKCLFTKCPRKD